MSTWTRQMRILTATMTTLPLSECNLVGGLGTLNAPPTTHEQVREVVGGGVSVQQYCSCDSRDIGGKDKSYHFPAILCDSKRQDWISAGTLCHRFCLIHRYQDAFLSSSNYSLAMPPAVGLNLQSRIDVSA